MRRLSSLWSAALLVVVAACGGNGQLGSRFVKSVPVTASQGATITVSSSDEPELAGTSLYIPPGALAFDTTITVEVGDSDIVTNASSAGPVAIFGPSGLIFHQPAKLTLPYDVAAGSEANLFVQVLEDDGRRFNVEHSALEVDTSQKLLRFNIDGFTAFQPGTTNASDGGNFTCTSNSQCAPSQVCVNGACQLPANDAGCNSAGGCNVCTSNAQCLSGQSCVNGSCQTTNAFDGGCAFGQCGGGGGGGTDAGSCSNGACNTFDGGSSGGVCSSTSQCSSGEVCLQGRCTASNTADAGCAPGTTCYLDAGSGFVDGGSNGGGGGSDAGSCAPGTTCYLDAGAVRTCNAPADCGAFGQCVNGVCI